MTVMIYWIIIHPLQRMDIFASDYIDRIRLNQPSQLYNLQVIRCSLYLWTRGLFNLQVQPAYHQASQQPYLAWFA